MSIKAVLFDLDGTLLDTAPDFKTALNQLLIEENREPLTEDEVKMMVSHGSANLIANAFKMGVEHADFELLRLRLLAFYLDCLSQNTRYFEGIESSLDYMKHNGIFYGIVTNKPARYSQKILKSLGIKVDCLVCPDHVKKPKPDPESLFYACNQLSCTPDQAIFVGDHSRDIVAGKAAGMPTVAAAYGYIPLEESVADWNADYTIQHPSELLGLLEQLA